MDHAVKANTGAQAPLGQEFPLHCDRMKVILIMQNFLLAYMEPPFMVSDF